MRQVLFTIPILGGVKIFGYGLMLFFAFLGSMNLAAWRARREKLDPEVIYDLALWVFVGGLLGARLFYVFQYWGVRIHSVWDVFKVWEGGIVLYGSIMGGAAAFFLYRALRPFPLRPMLDVIAPSLALGIALGRLGCFLNGCCYGDTCDLPWAVAFPKHSPPWESQHASGLIGANAMWSLPLHPTQLYSTIDGLILVLLLTAYYPLRRRDGEVMGLLMITYPITRFLIEHLRNDEGVFYAGLTISQNISLALLAGGLLFWFYLWQTPAVRFADDPKGQVPADELAGVSTGR
jgi:phosphatidylglycerol---prolipoprotein diacylglyceryl transferase